MSLPHDAAVPRCYRAQIVKFFMVLTFIASYPISVALDAALGKEMGTIYSKDQLKNLLQIYAQSADSDVKHEETKLVVHIHAPSRCLQGIACDISLASPLPNACFTQAGALDFATKTVHEVMTPMERVYSLSIDAKLDFETLKTIYSSGHSRIPIYEEKKDNIIAILHSKVRVRALFALRARARFCMRVYACVRACVPSRRPGPLKIGTCVCRTTLYVRAGRWARPHRRSRAAARKPLVRACCDYARTSNGSQDLIMLDPDDQTPIRVAVELCARKLEKVCSELSAHVVRSGRLLPWLGVLFMYSRRP